MKTEDFDYYLPEKLIAQTPLADRSSSKLMVLDKKTGEVVNKHFVDLLDYLEEGDALVLNDTKVLPARLIGIKELTKASIEILLLKELQDDVWEVLVKPAKRVKKGTIIDFGNNLLKGTCEEELPDGIRHLKFNYKGIFYEILDQLGTMPLPPYIHEQLADQSRYQTVYAKNASSAAAPTAGLHFTKKLLADIAAKKVNILFITLNVGLGTFRPVTVSNITDHHMHSEFYQINQETAKILNEVKASKHKIYSVGTTTTRTLETNMNRYGEFKESSGWTDIFIYPGYEFKAIDCLITNFHLPKSTLVMLVSALAGKDNIINAYKLAVKEEYRFFSFGDAMLIK